jgi:F0F1-type ATP synthase gamma subunit
MIPLIRLKQDVLFNKDFTKVVDVMKGIATSKFFQLQRDLAFNEPFEAAVQAILSQIDMAGMDHPLVNPRNPRRGVLLITMLPYMPVVRTRISW